MAKESIAVFIAAKEVKQKLMAVKKWFDGPVRTEQDKLAQAVVKMCIDEIDKIKPADAATVVHGRWISIGGNRYTRISQCSNCCAKYDFMSNYCPNCGAKMDLD